MDTVTIAFMQQADELHGLALCAALIEAIYDVQNVWLQDWKLKSNSLAP
jgi:hypothetical protein